MATTTRTRKVATDAAASTRKANPTITHGPLGTILVGAPFIIAGHGQVGTYLRVTDRNPDGLGWTFSKEDGKVWIMDGSAGKTTANTTRVRECVELFAGMGVTVDVKLTTRGKASATAPATDTAASTRKASTRTRKAAADTAATDTAATVRELLTALNLPADAVTATLAAVEAATDTAASTRKASTRTRKAATDTAASTRKASTRTRKAATDVKISTDADGDRVYTLADGARVRAIAKLVRKAIAADRRAAGVCAGADWHVYADTDARTLTVERVAEDGRAAGSEVDAVVLAAIA